MSEITLITKRYGEIVNFTSKINKSVIVFKKKSLLADPIKSKKFPRLEIKDSDLKSAKESLLQSLKALEDLAIEKDYDKNLIGVSESTALKTLVIKNETNRKEIESIVNCLKEDKQLSNTNFLMLDKIIAVLDSERNLLFKKLRTARG